MSFHRFPPSRFFVRRMPSAFSTNYRRRASNFAIFDNNRRNMPLHRATRHLRAQCRRQFLQRNSADWRHHVHTNVEFVYAEELELKPHDEAKGRRQQTSEWPELLCFNGSCRRAQSRTLDAETPAIDASLPMARLPKAPHALCRISIAFSASPSESTAMYAMNWVPSTAADTPRRLIPPSASSWVNCAMIPI